MLYLDRNENMFGPAPECISILRSMSSDNLSTYSRDYTRGVKSVLSETLAAYFRIPEERLLLSYGCEDMLKQIVHCYLGTGDTMMVPQYSWWYYNAIAGEVGGNVVHYPMHSDSSTFYYNNDEIIAHVKSAHPKLLFFASPNNPTGNSLPPDLLHHVLRSNSDILVVVDEAYFGFNGVLSATVPRLVHEYPNLAVLRTFSKLYGLAGLRIGYCCVGTAYEKLIAYCHRYLGYNTVSELLAMAAFRSERYYAALGATIAAERERYYDCIASFEGWKAYQSDANFILVKVPSSDIENLQRQLQEAKFAVKFFADEEFLSHIRITIGTPEQNTSLMKTLKSSSSNSYSQISTPLTTL